jgi:outer membrane protein OmpA-like peptidoglycan-associated protein/DNA-binding transcriptional MerR regulator
MNSINYRHVSLHELAKEYGLPLDTLVSFQNMGLIRPVQLANQKALFGPFSRLRIKFILNATSQGLSFADILTLIGKVPPFSDESAQLLKSLEMVEKNAAQLCRQIGISKPLEKVNRSCDLILLLSYIKKAKAILPQENKNGTSAPALIAPSPEKNEVEAPKLAHFPMGIHDETPGKDDILDEEIAHAAAKSVWRRLPLAICLIALLWVPFHFNIGDLEFLFEKGKQRFPSFFQYIGYGSSTSLPAPTEASGIAGNPSGGKETDPETLPGEDLGKPIAALPDLKKRNAPPATSESPWSKTEEIPLPDIGASESVIDGDLYLGKIQRRIPVPTQKIIIQYEHGSIDIADQDKKTMDVIADFVALYPATRLIIRGYTCSQGDPNYNMTLSESRAHQGKALLVAKGISPLNIETIGMGSANPIATNETADGRKVNHRIEVELLPDALP